MSNFTQIDLSQLPPPELIEALSYEEILAGHVADYQARNPDAVLLESDPAMKVLQTAAYREMLLRQDVNERARQCLLAYSTGNNLEHLASFYGVARGMLDPGDQTKIPPVPPTFESDTGLRARTQLAPEALSVAGPTGAYVFHGLSAGRTVKRMSVAAPDEETVIITYTFEPDPLAALARDTSAVSPVPGDVIVTVLSRDGDGTASDDLLEAVRTALSDEFVRPLTDRVMVQSAEIVPFRVEAVLEIPPGPDSSEVERLAHQRLKDYAETVHRLSGVAARSGIDAALHTAGVTRVVLTQPEADLICSPFEAPWLEGIDLSVRIVRADETGVPG